MEVSQKAPSGKNVKVRSTRMGYNTISVIPTPTKTRTRKKAAVVTALMIGRFSVLRRRRRCQHCCHCHPYPRKDTKRVIESSPHQSPARSPWVLLHPPPRTRPSGCCRGQGEEVAGGASSRERILTGWWPGGGRWQGQRTRKWWGDGTSEGGRW